MPVDGFNFVAAKAKPLAAAPQLSEEGWFTHQDGQKTHLGRENQRANNNHAHPQQGSTLATRTRKKAFWFGQGRDRCHHIAKSEFNAGHDKQGEDLHPLCLSQLLLLPRGKEPVHLGARESVQAVTSLCSDCTRYLCARN